MAWHMSDGKSIHLVVWLLWLSTISKGQPVLTGPTGSVCPGDVLMYTCVRAGTIANPTDTFVVFDFILSNGKNLVGTALRVSSLSTHDDIDGFLLFGNVSESSETVVTVTLLVTNATSEYNGAMVQCTVASETSNMLMVSIRSPAPPIVSSLSAMSTSESANLTLISWTSTPPADSYALTISPPPPEHSGEVSSLSTSLTISLSYNEPYTISVQGESCGVSGQSVSIEYTIVQCTVPEPPGNGSIVFVSGREEGATVTFQCDPGFTPVGVMSSECTSNGIWLPDPGGLQCSPITCPVLQTPVNGSSNFSSEHSSVGTRVQFECDSGLYPEGVMIATCLETGQWDDDLSVLTCRERPVNCSVPEEPENGAILNLADLNTTEGSVITFQCDPGFMPTTVMMADCNNSGHWSVDPALLSCTIGVKIVNTTDSAAAAIAGGVVGGVIATILLVLVVITVVVLLTQRKKEIKSSVPLTGDLEMTDKLQEYSELRHGGPKKKGSKKSHPFPAGPEEYDRITHNLNPGQTAYDDVNISPEKKSEEGYSEVSNGQGFQRPPGYGQLHSVTTVEPVVYADLSVSKKKRSEAPEVDQHTVTYSDVDFIATGRQKASTLPAPNLAEQGDKLLNLDQALVQLRSVQSRWQELAAALRVPDTYIQQIDDSCGKDHANSMTEVIDYWMRSCSGRPTWRELADALKRIKENNLSKQLLSIYETGRLPVELDMNEVPKEAYKYDNAPPPPVPARSPTITDESDSPGLSKTLPPSRPPRYVGDLGPSRPPKPPPKDGSPAPPRPPKPPRHQ